MSVRNGGLSGFLDDHVFAGLQRLDRYIAMSAGRCANDDDVDGNRGESIGEGREGLTTAFGG
jgi:hypothetical protein